MLNSKTMLLAALIATGTAFPASQLSAGFIPPIGLAPGSQYQLVFITADTRNATSSNIADYNAFVTAEAALNPALPSTSWHAIASTPTVDADVNAPVSNLPIYNTQGIEVMPTSSTFTLYTTSFLNAPILYDQFGQVPAQPDAWSGTVLGRRVNGATLGSSFVTYGMSADINEFWLGSIDETTRSSNLGLYALSGPITFVPEPSTLALAALGFITLAAWRLRRRRWSFS